jgi:hypothetical protein
MGMEFSIWLLIDYSIHSTESSWTGIVVRLPGAEMIIPEEDNHKNNISKKERKEKRPWRDTLHVHG